MDLFQIDEKIAIEFFSASEGYRILEWAVILATSYDPLKFLLKIFPKTALKEALKQKDFLIFKCFLEVESNLEDLTNEMKQLRQIETFKLLLSISQNEIKEVMFLNKEAKWMANGVYKNYECALNQYKNIKNV